MSFRSTGIKKFPYLISSCDEFLCLWGKQSAFVPETYCDRMSFTGIPATLCLLPGQSRVTPTGTKKRILGRASYLGWVSLDEADWILWCHPVGEENNGSDGKEKELPMYGYLLWWVPVFCVAQPSMCLFVRKVNFRPVGKNSSSRSSPGHLWLSGFPIGGPWWWRGVTGFSWCCLRAPVLSWERMYLFKLPSVLRFWTRKCWA